MHIFFSGIGGAGIGPLALIAKQAGYDVSGSDAKDSSYISYLKKQGIYDIHIGQTKEQISDLHSKNPIDWFVYSSALPMTDPNHPELAFCRDKSIKATRRDELLNEILSQKKLKLVAIAGTHGKTTTTAMAIWLFKQLQLPVSYSVGAKLSFGDMGHFTDKSEYFIYEADEFDRNFLNFYPELGIISGLDWDHPDIYPTRESYYEAFSEFIDQSNRTALWHDDAEKLGLEVSDEMLILDEKDPLIDHRIALPGHVNRLDAWLVSHALQPIIDRPIDEILGAANRFPGVSRRFEKLAANLYTDYAHTPAKIRGALQLAHEVAGDNVVVIYEGLHNLRQHFIKDELASLFDEVKQLYIVPSYLARENKDLELLTPDKLLNMLSNSSQSHTQAAQLNDQLATDIRKHSSAGDLVLCLTAGGTGSLDEWLRQNISRKPQAES
ncbi:MAG TPA: Mur ligase domain-containing protein [Candidatus Saccharimonadales bacterium]|nr:Mur ligase domain-containing protein [Candidatus Saccharimonadales bacterium]